MFDQLAARLAVTIALVGIVLPGISAAQDFECEAVPETPCALLNLAIDRWPIVIEQYETKLQPSSIDYIGDAESAEFESAVDKLLTLQDQTFLVLHADDGFSEIIASEKFDSAFLIPWKETIEQTVGKMQHVVKITWDAAGDEFSTTAFLSEAWPYIFDPVLSSVVLEDETNSCMHKTLRWLWGTTRGEILLDVLPIQTGSGMICKRVGEAWMSFGDAQVVSGEPQISGHQCAVNFAYAWATPLATISADAKNVSVTVEGIGSKFVGSRDCISE